MANLSTKICGIKLSNPTILASGILGVTKSSLKNVVSNGAGAVIIKSISKEPRKGHNNPILITYEGGMINAVGYSNPGLEEAKNEFTDLAEVGAPVIASIIGTNAEDFAYMAKNFLTKEFAAVEAPLSCPHTPGFGTLAGQGTPEATFAITKAIKQNTNLPLIIKLSPNIPNLVEIAKAAQAAGADALNMGNTHGPGMVIDIETKQPTMDFKVGGLSGPAIRPVAVRCVYDIYPNVKIPIIGCGGITTWRDGIEMLMAGASALNIGSAVYYEGIDVFKKICQGISDFMDQHGYKTIQEMVGLAHKN
ncbi:MAG: dihydroorotate dehydrogenase [Patescibacteria group bacterium]